MKFLRSIIKRQHTSLRWALLSGTVLWLSVAVVPPALAAPIDYHIDNGFFSGTFTLNNTLLTSPFSIWSITPNGGPTFTPISHLILINDQSFYPGIPSLIQADGPMGFIQFKAFPDLTYSAFWTPVNGGPNFAYGGGSYSAVPESEVSILLAIGLLSLAGSRWLPGRRVRQQLG
jgi:hypothetical protein